MDIGKQGGGNALPGSPAEDQSVNTLEILSPEEDISEMKKLVEDLVEGLAATQMRCELLRTEVDKLKQQRIMLNHHLQKFLNVFMLWRGEHTSMREELRKWRDFKLR
ncbi:hypothetical protein R1flu_001416 [Riccia fluitans]|uniref:Uncharacterized protein n=1 Tax=Riccia fluitans TaxID=41844 RepID=A0ABD1Y3K1_9MARC